MDVLVIPADAERPDGPEVVRKTASLPGERQRLLREAEVLRAAAEQGLDGLATVVAAPSPEADQPSLVTAAAAGPSLAVAAPLPVLQVAGVAAEVARLLAGLHEARLVHGAVEPSHVVLDGAGGAILVGLGSGGPVGAPSSDPQAAPLDPAEDVGGWGALVTHLLDWSATTDEEPLVALRRALATRRVRRVGRRRPQGRPGQDERRVLAALADSAQDPDPARRPAARSLAAAIAHRIPGAHVPGQVGVAPGAGPAGDLLDRLSPHLGHDAHPGPDPGPGRGIPGRGQAEWEGSGVDPQRRPSGRIRPGWGAGARPAPTPSPFSPPEPRRPAGKETADPPAVAPTPLARMAWAAAAARLSGRADRRLLGVGLAGALLLLGAPVALARLRPPEPSGPTATIAPVRCGPATPPAADVDGDGCEEAVRWSDGVLQAGSVRFALGAPGDAWAVGDWDCDGRRTAALLHGGTLTVFDAWPGPGGELHGREVVAGTGASGLSAVPTGGCDRPSLRRPGRSDLVVDPGTPP